MFFYNNILTKQYFQCPNFEGKVLKPNLKHMKRYIQFRTWKKCENSSPSDKVLHPATIEKSNFSLTDSMFHESTIAALTFYAIENNCPAYNETANFFQLVRHWWNLLNFKSTFTGEAKRDSN